jgi:chromosome segregation ATPase
MDNTTAIHSFSIADMLGLFFQYDPIFAYLSTLTLFLSFIYFSEWKESDLVRLAKHQLGLSKSENMQLQQLIEKKDVQLDVLKKRHERELNQTAQSLQHDINRANEGLHKLEQELRKTEQQIESYEREADNNARMIERLQHQVDEEIAKRESTLKRAEEMEAEKESYRTEVIRITHMLNHKKIELEHLKKEIRTLRSSQTNAKAKQADKQLGERD